MKPEKFNWNFLLFLFAAIFVLSGTARRSSFSRLKDAGKDMLTSFKQADVSGVSRLKSSLELISDKELRYHNMLMDLNSVRENLLGTRILQKGSTVIVKSDSGSLSDEIREITGNEMEEPVSRINKLKEVSEQYGAHFLYCAAPGKELYEAFPLNAENSFAENYKSYLTQLEGSGIPVLDCSAAFRERNLPDSDLFYKTDHHWQIRTGFHAASAICEELSRRYGFVYDPFYSDLSNYTITVYPDWFLGSKGKKTGTYFTSCGPDDFELITPGFPTQFREEQPFRNEVREGRFEDTLLYMKNMKKDFYKVNTYATYSGGDFRLQIMKNMLNPEGRKILMVRDSFACAAAPFLALYTSELHLCDMRNFSYFIGDKINVEDYIRETRPDYVVVLFTGICPIKLSDGRYDFF